MIVGLDHVVVAVRDLDAAADGYARLLGVTPERGEGDGAGRAWFGFPNIALMLVGVVGEGAGGDRVRTQLDRDGEGVWTLAFAADDLDAAARLVARRGVRTAPVGPSVRLERADTGGLQLFLSAPAPTRAASADPAVVQKLDHVVVHTADPTRALAVYGARLGLDLRLDRENPQWNARQIFFRAGDAVVEIGARLGGGPSAEPDRFGGLAWRVADPDAARARMAAAGFDVSEVRTGRKPGTKVFTVRDAPGGVPTLMIQQDAEAAA